MEEILAQELNNMKKLQDLQVHRNEISQKYGRQEQYESIRDIPLPVDSSMLAKNARDAAVRRNADFLQELDISAGKLHTKRLCPIHEKLNELKNNFWESQEESPIPTMRIHVDRYP